MSESIKWSLSKHPLLEDLARIPSPPPADGLEWDKISDGLMSDVTQNFPLN